MKRVVVIGGGPGGLFFARLLKLAERGLEVTVFERNPGNATFGFGVSIGGRGFETIGAADPEVGEALQAAGLSHSPRQSVVRAGVSQVWDWPGWQTLSIARVTLLEELQRLASEAGVELLTERETSLTEVEDMADVIVAADGVNSLTREALTATLGPSIEPGLARFIWLGAKLSLEHAAFIFESDECGSWASHTYPYGGGMSGFMIETDPDTLRRSGLDASSKRAAERGEPDALSKGYLEQLFASTLQGAELVMSRSYWSAFNVVRNERWSSGKVVLLGDAAHTAHPSIGSGTRMAMEDSISLSRALVEERELTAAFARYEAERRPQIALLQQAALMSQRWWETFHLRLASKPTALAINYLARTGRYTLQRLDRHDPNFTGQVREAFVQAARSDTGINGSAPAPFEAPLRIGSTLLPVRTVESAPAGQSAEAEAGLCRLTLEDAESFDPALIPADSIVEISVDGTFDSAVLLPAVARLAESLTVGVHLAIVGVNPDSASAVELIDLLLRARDEGADLIHLDAHGLDSDDEFSEALRLADLIRWSVGCRVCLTAEASRADRLETALVAESIDLVELAPERSAARL